MATGSGAFSVNPGFNQSGGGYYITLSTIIPNMLTFTPGTGSGGATTSGTFAPYTWGNAGSDASYSTFVGANRVIKDMGKSVVSAGRTFRKFQAVIPSSVGTLGVAGASSNGSATTGGYLTFYLEIARDGTVATTSIPLIARYA
jgi:hypothetical protein